MSYTVLLFKRIAKYTARFSGGYSAELRPVRPYGVTFDGA